MKSKHLRLALTGFISILLIATITAIACAPAAPPDQGADPNEESRTAEQSSPTKTPTPTLDPECRKIHDPDPTSTKMITVCPEPGPKNVHHNLRRAYNDHMKAKEEHQQGPRSDQPPPARKLTLIINIDTVENGQTVQDFIALHDTGVVEVINGIDPPNTVQIWVYNIDLGLVNTIAAMDGVAEVVEPPRSEPQGSSLHPLIQPASTASAIMGSAAWNEAGIQGQGVEIAIVDQDFRTFDTRVLPKLQAPVKYLCFDSTTGTAAEGTLPYPITAATPIPADFSSCSINSPTSPAPHGTEVTDAAVDVAPQATYYIAKVDSALQLDHAVEWLTAKRLDNADSTRPYSNTSNDSFDVDLINHSVAYQWEGPGDGSPITSATRTTSQLKNSNVAISRGVLWVNAAGNYAKRTWFSRTPNFNPQNYLDVDPANANDCNTVKIKQGTDYFFQARWNGTWGSEDKNIDIFLQGPFGITSQPPPISHQSMTTQTGLTGDNPYETLSINLPSIPQPTRPTPITEADYCLWISKADPTDRLNWIQVQMFSGEGNLAYSTPTGSINNPAESSNAGLIAVGATDNAATPTVKDFSARGPVPEPHPNGRTEPDLVAPNTTIPGTSFSAPRIAGVAALAIQAIGNRGEYDQPHEIVDYLKAGATNHASPDNDLGHGLPRLPKPTPPENVAIEQVSADNKLTLTFDHTTWDAAKADHTNVNYVFRILKSVTHQSDPIEISSGKITGRPTSPSIEITNLEYNAEYWATVKTCAGSTALHCGPESSTSIGLTIEPLAAPLNLTATLKWDKIILSWEAVPGATGYRVFNPNYPHLFNRTSNTNYEELIGHRYGANFTFAVQAYTSSTTSDVSNHSKISTPLVTPPVNLRFTSKPGTTNIFDITFDHTNWPLRAEAADGLFYEVRVTAQEGNHRPRTFHPPHRFENDAQPFARTVEQFDYHSFYFAQARTCLTTNSRHCGPFSTPTPTVFPDRPGGKIYRSETLVISDGETAIVRWNPTHPDNTYDVGLYNTEDDVYDPSMFDPQDFDTSNGQTGLTTGHGIISDVTRPTREHVFAVLVNSPHAQHLPTPAGFLRSLYDPIYRASQRKTLDDIQFRWLDPILLHAPYLDFGSQILIQWDWDHASALHEIQVWDGTAGKWVTLRLHEETSPNIPFIKWETIYNALINNVPSSRPLYIRARGIYGDNIDEWSPTLEIPPGADASPPIEPRPPTLPDVSDFQVSTTERTTTSASLSWAQSQGATSYEIDSGNADNRVTSTDTSATVDNLEPNTEYTFRVRARNGLDTSEWSTPVTITTHPVAPTGLQASPRPDSVRLTWDPVNGVDGYEVTVVGSDSTTSSSNTDAVIDGLTSGSTYSFAARSQSAERRSVWSDPITVTLPPATPDVTAQGIANGKVQLSWSAVTGVTSYKVHQCDRHTGTWRTHPYTEQGQAQPFSITSSTTSATISGLTDQITYTFRAASVNDHGTSWSQPIDGTPGTEPPNAPQSSPGGKLCPSEGTVPSNLQATVTTSAVSLTWTPGTKPRYVEQKVLRRVAGVSPIDWTEISVASNDNAYTDTQGVSGTRYIYRIQALKANGVGDISNNQEVTFP